MKLVLLTIDLLAFIASITLAFYMDFFPLILTLQLWFPAKQFQRIVLDSIVRLDKKTFSIKLFNSDVQQVMNGFQDILKLSESINEAFGGIFFLCAVDYLVFYSSHTLDVLKADYKFRTLVVLSFLLCWSFVYFAADASRKVCSTFAQSCYNKLRSYFVQG